jgi:hypothetical protein
MNIIIFLMNWVFSLALCMSVLFTLRHIFLFIRHLNNPEPKPYEIETKSLIYLGLSISTIITSLIHGFAI